MTSIGTLWSAYESGGRRSLTRVLLRLLYWAAVLVVSLALLVGLVLFFESRDDSTLQEGASGQVASARSSRAKTTIRLAALYSGWQALRMSRSNATFRVTDTALGLTMRLRSTR